MHKGGFAYFAARRILVLIVQLFALLTVAFIVIRVIPGDPAAALLGSQGTTEALAQLRHNFGIDRPLLVQYREFLAGLLHGDLGESWRTGRPISEDIQQRLPITLQLITTAMLAAVVVALPLGVMIASGSPGRTKRLAGTVARSYGLLAGAMPEFWLALLFILLFFVKLNVVPGPFGLLEIGMEPPPSRTGFIVLDSILDGDWAALRSSVSHFILPVLVLTLTTAAALLRMTMSEMDSAFRSEYVRHARSLGIPERQIIRYALKTAGGPILTLIGVLYGFLIGGAVLVETVFALGGFGQYAVEATLTSDYPALLGFLTVSGTFVFVIYLLLDLAHALLDPRIR